MMMKNSKVLWWFSVLSVRLDWNQKVDVALQLQSLITFVCGIKLDFLPHRIRIDKFNG